MSSVVEICNLALSHIGIGQIQSVSDLSKSARESLLLFAPTRDAVLSDFPWNFSTMRETLALTTETVSGWDYAYAYPSECLRVRELYNPASQEKIDAIKYSVCLNRAGNRRLILSNQSEAELVYTFRVIDPNLYDSTFVKAMSYALAAELAVPLKGNPQLKDMLRKEYSLLIGAAQVANAKENEERPDERSSYERARG